MRWTVLDAALDSSGRSRGEERGPGALRAAGLLAALDADDGGTVDARIHDATRDPATGLIGAEQVRRASRAIAAQVAAVRAAGRHPLVVGGDCTILLGVFLALPRGSGLWFLDGHPDFQDGIGSATGEGADMELSILTGHGPDLFDTAAPLVAAELVRLVGHRPPGDEEARREADRVDPRIPQLPAAELRRRGAGAVGRELAAEGAGPAWLHLDVDVLDPRVLPAVTYPEPDGLDWADLLALITPLVRSGRLLGMSVADLDADGDPDGRHARRLVEVLAAALSP
ncbi:arginase family protein [Micromonospora purpureochromogenes]|uniref:arginase family protein n=1 Tax=Micromonospora purpureochromogenes TaxID=47872 RepID=UPI000B5AEE31|nr:arginase family protein [Micromonospora purpureochromogenes]